MEMQKGGCCSCSCPVTKLAKVLVLVGGLNWGLIGVLNFNLVNTLLGSWPMVERIVYVLVGVSAVFLAVKMAMMMRGSCDTKKM